MAQQTAPSRWAKFWNRGGWWKALIVAVVYLALYEAGGLLLSLIIPAPEPGSALEVLLRVALPIALGSVVLIVFAISIGWLQELFARQPIRGRWWMWIAVGAVLLFNVLRFASLDYGSASLHLVVAWLITGLFVGFAEETLTRGFVVNLMRKAGHPEIAVALVSATTFALLHSVNLLSGQDLVTTAMQVVYTFAFGLCMYLTLRVTGHLIWPILLHASTDPSIFLHGAHPAAGAISSLADLGNIVVIITGLVLLIFIRGRVERPADPALRAQGALG